MMQTVYGVETMFRGAYSPEFQANEKGEVFLLDTAGKWIDDLEDDNRENFLNRKASNVVLQAENDVAFWFSDKQRSINRYDAKKLSGDRLSLLARVIIEEVIMTRYEQLTEESKTKALSAPDSNMLFRSQKRIIAMHEGILKPDGFRLTGPDVEVLQTAISLEIDAARQRQQQTAATAGDQEAKPEIKKLVEGHTKYSDWDDKVFEAIDSIKETTQEKRVTKFCEIYKAPPALLSAYKAYSTRCVTDGNRRPRRQPEKKV